MTLACRRDALTPAEQERREELTRGLAASARSVQELPRGWAFRFADTDGLAAQVVEWMALERRRCPFLDFEVLFGAPGEAILLRVTGKAEATRELLAAELPGLISRPRRLPDPPRRRGRRPDAA